MNCSNEPAGGEATHMNRPVKITLVAVIALLSGGLTFITGAFAVALTRDRVFSVVALMMGPI
jgi:hypothetical protein